MPRRPPAGTSAPPAGEAGGDAGSSAGGAGLDAVDAARIGALCVALRSSTTEGLLTEVFHGVPGAAELVGSISKYCVFDHGAILVFPDRFEDVIQVLPDMGAFPGETIPSVIVKSRLSERYGIDPSLLDVRLTHAALGGLADYPRKIEVFMARRGAHLTADIVSQERALELERHFALRLPNPDPVVVQGLRWVMREQAGYQWDGGGFNPADDPAGGGTSVLYFLKVSTGADGAERRQRIEVKFAGDYSYLTRTHGPQARP